MTRIELASELGDDLECILEPLLAHDAADVGAQIIHAIDVLAHSPLIGRPLDHAFRELVIGRDAQGYIALYRYIESADTALVLAMRGQCEAGYAKD